MGFMDSLKDAFGDHEPQPVPTLVLAQGRHADRDAPAERMEDAELVTGGKHKR
jgi:hypothetical protein